MRPEAAIANLFLQPAGFTGHVMLLCMIFMYITASAYVRNLSFNTFRYTHWLYWLFMLAYLTHSTGCFVRDVPYAISPSDVKAYWQHCHGYRSWIPGLLVFILYLAEQVFLKYFPQKVKLLNVRQLDYRFLELKFAIPKWRKFVDGQWILLESEKIRPGERHPFSVASHDSKRHTLCVQIKIMNGWTKELGDSLGVSAEWRPFRVGNRPTDCWQNATRNDDLDLTFNIHGPFGTSTLDICDQEVIILACNGVGITPWLSLLNSFVGGKYKDLKVRQFYMVWMVEDTVASNMVENVGKIDTWLKEQTFGAYEFIYFHKNTGERKLMDFENESSLKRFDGEDNRRLDVPGWLRRIRKKMSALNEEKSPKTPRPIPKSVNINFCGSDGAKKSVESACTFVNKEHRVPKFVVTSD